MLIPLTAPRCFGYLRVSTERQADESLTSVDDQRIAIEALATTLGVTVDRWFVDPGASGASAERREEFMAMVAAAQQYPHPSRTPGYILVLNDSRLGRFGDPEEAGYWRVAFRKLGWVMRFAEGDEITDVKARAFVRMAAGMQAAEYRETIRRNATRGSRGTAAQGYWVSSAPFGYRRAVVYPPDRARVLANGVPKAKDEKVKLAPEASEAALVRTAFTRYAEPGETLASVAAWLSMVAPSRGWTKPAVRWMLSNRAYVGDVVIGSRVADEDDPTHQRRRPTAERWGRDNAHEPLIDRDTFARVSAKLAENRRAPRSARGTYPLSGVLRCGECGSPLVGGRTKPKQGVAWYRCAGALKREPICPPGGSVARHLVEPLVIDALAGLLSRPAVRERIIAAVDATLAAFADPSADRALAQAETAATERQRRLVAAIASGTLTDAEAAPQMIELRTELRRIDAARANEKFVAARRASMTAERDAILAKVLDAPARLKAANGAALREQLAFWCSALTYHRTTRTVHMAVRTGIPLSVVSANRAAAASPEHPEQSAQSDDLALDVTLPAPRRKAASFGARTAGGAA